QLVAVLTGANGCFCAGADLSAVVKIKEKESKANLLSSNMEDMGPMGPTRLFLSKPVIAAIEGFCVAGGLELAAWCDLRISKPSSTFGVFCRLRGVPLIDGGTVRLPKLIGRSRALDLILTGRSLSGTEAFNWGLVNRLVPENEDVLTFTINFIKNEILPHPQLCLQMDRKSIFDEEEEKKLLAIEFKNGLKSLNDQNFGTEIKKFFSKL
ncbi:hypothetical protein HK099_002233, partial [Clydaea vesicula]